MDVLLKIYAKCLDGEEDVALKRIGAALGRPLKTRPMQKVETGVTSRKRPPPPPKTPRAPRARH